MKINRKDVLAMYNGHCAYCGGEIDLKTMQVDHMLAKRFGGSDKPENLMPSCASCNHYKRAGTIESYRDMMKTLHKRIQQIYIVKVAIRYGLIEIKPFDGVFYYEKHKTFVCRYCGKKLPIEEEDKTCEGLCLNCAPF